MTIPLRCLKASGVIDKTKYICFINGCRRMSSQGGSLTGVGASNLEGPKPTEKCGTSLEVREEDANLYVS